MKEPGQRRKLAAILSADVVGYSRLMQDDDAATVETLTKYRRIFSDFVSRHEGRIVDSPGDNILAEFDSPVEAVQCAVEIERELGRRNLQLAEHRRMHFRIGINLGDILSRDDGTIYGDGVNVAARLESLAEPGGIMISESARMQVRTLIDVGIADAGEHEVKNIAEPVHAYRIVLDETAARRQGSRKVTHAIIVTTGTAALVIAIVAGVVFRSGGGPEDPILAMPSGPSIAVLPFENFGGDPEYEYFADGITEDILTGLSKFNDLKVVGRSSSFKYKGKSVEITEVGNDLNVDYVLEGSVRRTANTVRVTAQLLNASDGTHIWAKTLDRNLTTRDVLAIQDDITGSVVSAIGGVEGAIASSRIQALRRLAPTEIAAYDCVLLAYHYQQVITEESHLAARTCLEKVVDREPNYVDALAWLGQMYLEEIWSDFNPRLDGPPALDSAFEVLNRAVTLDSNHQRAHHALAVAYFHKKDVEQFRVEAKRALSLNPNHIDTIVEMGQWLGFSGYWDESAALIAKAKRLGGQIPSYSYWTEFHYHYHRGEYEKAIDAARQTVELGHYGTPAYMAAAYGQLGNAPGSRDSLAAAVRLEPEFSRAMLDELLDNLLLDHDHHLLVMEGIDKAFVLASAPE